MPEMTFSSLKMTNGQAMEHIHQSRSWISGHTSELSLWTTCLNKLEIPRSYEAEHHTASFPTIPNYRITLPSRFARKLLTYSLKALIFSPPTKNKSNTTKIYPEDAK